MWGKGTWKSTGKKRMRRNARSAQTWDKMRTCIVGGEHKALEGEKGGRSRAFYPLPLNKNG